MIREKETKQKEAEELKKAHKEERERKKEEKEKQKKEREEERQRKKEQQELRQKGSTQSRERKRKERAQPEESSSSETEDRTEDRTESLRPQRTHQLPARFCEDSDCDTDSNEGRVCQLCNARDPVDCHASTVFWAECSHCGTWLNTACALGDNSSSHAYVCSNCLYIFFLHLTLFFSVF